MLLTCFMMKKAKYFDLNEVKRARNYYIKGNKNNKNEQFFPTLDIIAKEYSIGLSRLKQIAANNQWSKKRKDYKQSLLDADFDLDYGGIHSKVTKITRNTICFVEFSQEEFRKILLKHKNGEIKLNIKEFLQITDRLDKMQKLVNSSKKLIKEEKVDSKFDFLDELI